VERFQQLYVDHFPALSGYCASLVENREIGAELAQEAFTRLFARWRSVHDPRAFVFFVGTNLATDHWRRRRRDTSLLARLRFERARIADRPASGVVEAIAALPRPLREVVLLYYYADLPLADVATATGRPLGTVKRQLHDARARLRDLMEES
jgi:RNA polymerase sigma-70 factor (ECF subfamily)